jgi:hypothetical protein
METYEDLPPDVDPESIIQQWKSQEPASLEENLESSPVGELNEAELDAVAGGAMPMTVTFGCDYSYEHRPSCGNYCTITYECMCSAQE